MRSGSPRGFLAAACCLAITLATCSVAKALFCDPGTYFDGHKCSLCPGGSFGATPGLLSRACSGVCTAGFFCPAGSTSSREKPCGTSIYYCPQGSADRRRVDAGYYTVKFPLEKDEPSSTQTAITAPTQTRCDTGHYCVFGIRRACPAGTYGGTTRLTTVECSGKCPKGFYCPEATSRPQPCPAGTFGEQEGLATAACTDLCPLGHYCESGTIAPKPCPPGTFGGARGLTTKACSSSCSKLQDSWTCLPSPCPAGFYCPLAAAEPVECGAVDVFCPEGSAEPTPVSEGHYTTWRTFAGTSMAGEPLEAQYIDGYALASLNQTTRTDQRICESGSYCSGGTKRLCPPGVYGASSGLATAACTAPCPPGYFCPVGTADYFHHPCASRTAFCPEGSSLPTPVAEGYFTLLSAVNLRTDQSICPEGSFCINGVAYLCPEGTYGDTQGLASRICSGRCQDGYLCPRGSVSATQTPCPAGSYSRDGIKCVPCSPGYWCTEASPDPKQNACDSDMTYCPLGSSTALPVLDSYYAVGQQLDTHTAQALCELRSAPHLPQCPSRTVGRNREL